MKEIIADPNLIAYCGLYCGACKKYLKGKCPGCKENTKATWCKIKQCCEDNSYKNCADCKTSGYEKCNYFNNFVAKIFAFIFNSNRGKCIDYISNNSNADFAEYMAKEKKMSFKRK